MSITRPNSRTPRSGATVLLGRAGDQVAQRSLEFYAAVGRQFAIQQGGR